MQASWDRRASSAEVLQWRAKTYTQWQSLFIRLTLDASDLSSPAPKRKDSMLNDFILCSVENAYICVGFCEDVMVLMQSEQAFVRQMARCVVGFLSDLTTRSPSLTELSIEFSLKKEWRGLFWRCMSTVSRELVALKQLRLRCIIQERYLFGEAQVQDITHVSFVAELRYANRTMMQQTLLRLQRQTYFPQLSHVSLDWSEAKDSETDIFFVRSKLADIGFHPYQFWHFFREDARNKAAFLESMYYMLPYLGLRVGRGRGKVVSWMTGAARGAKRGKSKHQAAPSDANFRGDVQYSMREEEEASLLAAPSPPPANVQLSVSSLPVRLQRACTYSVRGECTDRHRWVTVSPWDEFLLRIVNGARGLAFIPYYLYDMLGKHTLRQFRKKEGYAVWNTEDAAIFPYYAREQYAMSGEFWGIPSEVRGE